METTSPFYLEFFKHDVSENGSVSFVRSREAKVPIQFGLLGGGSVNKCSPKGGSKQDIYAINFKYPKDNILCHFFL
jgi:hypothetical protein